MYLTLFTRIRLVAATIWPTETLCCLTKPSANHRQGCPVVLAEIRERTCEDCDAQPGQDCDPWCSSNQR